MEQKKYQLTLKNNRYGETHLLYLEDVISKDDAELFSKPKCIIDHNLSDVFRDFMLGLNMEIMLPLLRIHFLIPQKLKNPIKSENFILRAKNPNPDNLFDAAFSIPVMPVNAFETALRSYGQNLKFYGRAQVSLFTYSGDLIYSRRLTQNELEELCGESSFELSKIINEAKVSLECLYSATFTFCDKKIPRFLAASNWVLI